MITENGLSGDSDNTRVGVILTLIQVGTFIIYTMDVIHP